MNISKTYFPIIIFLMKTNNWPIYTYKFSLHSDTFFEENSVECAKAWALQGKAKKKKRQNLIMSPYFYSFEFYFLPLFIFLNARYLP